MGKNFKNISKYYTVEFFEKLIEFIFKEDFDSFYSRKLKEQRFYVGYDDALWQMTEEDDDGNSDIYPITYDYFLNMYKNVGCCTSFVDERLFCIKYLMKELFEKSDSELLQNENVSINLNKNIIINEYKKVFITDLENFDDRLLNLNNKNSVDLRVKKFFCFIFDYIQAFLENLLEKIVVDSEQLITSYGLETKYNIVSKRKNKSTEENSLCRELKNECKRERTKRFNKEKGREKSEIVGYFPYNYEKLELEMQRIKNEFNSHPYIKEQLKKLANKKKPESDENVRKSIYKYLVGNSQELYFTADGEIEQKDACEIMPDVSFELLNVIDNYIYLKTSRYYFGISDAIRYTLLEISGDLKLYQQGIKDLDNQDFDIIKDIYNDFARRKGCKHFCTIPKLCSLYKTNDFQEKYRKFHQI